MRKSWKHYIITRLHRDPIYYSMFFLVLLEPRNFSGIRVDISNSKNNICAWLTSNSSSGIYLVFSGLAANIRKSIPFEVQSGFRPLPRSHHFKTKLTNQINYDDKSQNLGLLLHPLLRKADNPGAEQLSRLLPCDESVQFLVILKSEFITL